MNITEMIQHLMGEKNVPWAIASNAMSDAKKQLAPKKKRGFKGLGTGPTDEDIIARALELLDEPARQPAAVEGLNRVKKVTKKPIAQCRKAMAAANYDADRAIAILQGEVEDTSVATPAKKLRPVKGWERRVGRCAADGDDVAVIAVRRKKLTREERRIKKEMEYNGEYPGHVQDLSLMWQRGGTWHKVTGPVWSIVGFALREGNLVYAQNVSATSDDGTKTSARITTLSAPGEVVEAMDLPFAIGALVVGTTGMVVATTGRNPAVWARNWGGQWQELPSLGWSSVVVCGADDGYWVCQGPNLQRFAAGAWHKVHTRGTRGPGPFISLSVSGERVAAIQHGEIWAGDARELKPVAFSGAPRCVWFEDGDLVIEEPKTGLWIPERATQKASIDVPALGTKGTVRANVSSRGTPTIVRAKAQLWRRAGGTEWTELPPVPLWDAVGAADLEWESDPPSWLPPLPGAQRLPRPVKKKKPPKNKPSPDAAPSMHEVLTRVLAGKAGVSDLAKAVEAGADVNEISAKGEPPLTAALRKGDVKATSWLARNGAAASVPFEAEVSGKRVETTSPLAYAARVGNLKVVKRLVAGDADLGGTDIGMTALAHAVCEGHTEIAEILRNHEAPLRSPHPRAYSPLRKLFQRAPAEALELLGALEEEVKGKPGEDALIEMLVQRAAGNDTQAELDALLAHGARATTARAVRLAIETGQREALIAFLEAGADANTGNPLYLALRTPPIDHEAVSALLSHGANPSDGDTGALFYAVCADDAEAAKRLVAAGADPQQKHYHPDHMRRDPLTAYEHAVEMEAEAVAAYLRSL